jgi:hypothetical protein
MFRCETLEVQNKLGTKIAQAQFFVLKALYHSDKYKRYESSNQRHVNAFASFTSHPLLPKNNLECIVLGITKAFQR